MNLVKSKYKNPDRYIKRLKDDMAWYKGQVKRLRENWYGEIGTYWFTYDDHTATINMEVSEATGGQIHQRVKVLGRIIGFEQTGKGYRVKLNLEHVHLIKED